MKKSFLVLAIVAGCGGGGGGSSDDPSGSAPAPSEKLMLRTDVNGDGVADTVVIDKTKPPGQRVVSVVSHQGNQPLPASSVGTETVDAALAWDAQTSSGQSTIYVNSKPAFVRRVH